MKSRCEVIEKLLKPLKMIRSKKNYYEAVEKKKRDY